MSVFKRKTKTGYTKNYHYRFKLGGKLYYGACRECTLKKDALIFEQKERERIEKLLSQKNVKALIENFKDELADGDLLNINDVWNMYKGYSRAGKRQEAMLKQRWEDFLIFMQDNYPDIIFLNHVAPEHAEEYVNSLIRNGPWRHYRLFDQAKTLNIPVLSLKKYLNASDFPKNKSLKEQKKWVDRLKKNQRNKGRKTGNAPITLEQLSSETINKYISTLKSVFNKLETKAKITKNPFGKIKKLENKPVRREAFTPDELVKIGAASRDNWIYPLFMVGVNTGLREGDICELRWREVDLKTGWINRTMNKTGKSVKIPIMPVLSDYMQSLPQEGTYCFPELKKRYNTNRTSIGNEITKFLTGLGIESQRKVKGRSRAVSVRDIHSCRHTFCYIAALNQIPLPIVQSVVGHMDAEMTKRYLDHANETEVKKAFEQIPDYIGDPQKILNSGTQHPLKIKIISSLETLGDAELQKIVLFIDKIK